MSGESEKLPITFTAVKWYGYIFSACFIVFGGVRTVLEIMDNSYQNTMENIVFLLLGIVLISLVFAYRDMKNWGWYGMLVVNALVVVGTLITIGTYPALNGVLLVFSLGTIALLMLPSTKSLIFKGN